MYIVRIRERKKERQKKRQGTVADIECKRDPTELNNEDSKSKSSKKKNVRNSYSQALYRRLTGKRNGAL